MIFNQETCQALVKLHLKDEESVKVLFEGFSPDYDEFWPLVVAMAEDGAIEVRGGGVLTRSAQVGFDLRASHYRPIPKREIDWPAVMTDGLELVGRFSSDGVELERQFLCGVNYTIDGVFFRCHNGRDNDGFTPETEIPDKYYKDISDD